MPEIVEATLRQLCFLPGACPFPPNARNDALARNAGSNTNSPAVIAFGRTTTKTAFASALSRTERDSPPLVSHSSMFSGRTASHLRLTISSRRADELSNRLLLK